MPITWKQWRCMVQTWRHPRRNCSVPKLFGPEKGRLSKAAPCHSWWKPTSDFCFTSERLLLLLFGSRVGVEVLSAGTFKHIVCSKMMVIWIDWFRILRMFGWYVVRVQRSKAIADRMRLWTRILGSKRDVAHSLPVWCGSWQMDFGLCWILWLMPSFSWKNTEIFGMGGVMIDI